MNIKYKKIQIRTNTSFELINISSEVNDFIRKNDISNGFILVYTRHTTTALLINENESGLLKDIKNALEKLIPEGAGYQHDKIDNNAHSHLRAVLLGNSLSIPIIDGNVDLGKWQSIIFVELDGPRNRSIILQSFSE
jgi:secondary thiamine-phosphate synthase enzyme